MYRMLAASLTAIILIFSHGVGFAKPMDETSLVPESGKEASIWKKDTVNPSLLEGSFFQPSLVLNWTNADFAAEFDVMRSLGMNHIIWQWTIDSKEKQACYPTVLPGYSQLSPRDLVGISLEEAEKKGLKVWIGLNCNDDWFTYYANNEKWLANETSLSISMVQELWCRYGPAYTDTIAGFYLPLEVDNVHFKNKERQSRMAKAYKELAEMIHVTTSKPVMIAPFFNEGRGQDARTYAEMWGNILKVAPIDVIALQDGIGCEHASVSSIGNWLEALGTKIREIRPATELWSDLETFTTKLQSAPIERVISQIQAEKQYVTKITSFSFNHYDSPNTGHAGQFLQYKEYVDSLRKTDSD